MKQLKLFENGKSQALRIPKELRFDGESVFVKKVNGGLFLFQDPVKLIQIGIEMMPDDLEFERDQNDYQERDFD